MGGKGTPATVAAARAKIPHILHSYEVPDGTEHAYGADAARALAVPPEQIFKTLVAQVDGTLVVAVVPVSGELDLKALAAAVGGKKAAMADPPAAERATGYVRGGISPLGQRKRLTTVLDDTALRLRTIYVSAGRRGLQIELSPEDLVRLTGARAAAVSRPG